MNIFKFLISKINKYFKYYFLLKNNILALIIFFFYITIVSHSPSYFDINDLNNIEKQKKILTGRIYQLNGEVYQQDNKFFIKIINNKPGYKYEIVLPHISKIEKKKFKKLIGYHNKFLFRFHYTDFNFVNKKRYKLSLIKIL